VRKFSPKALQKQRKQNGITQQELRSMTQISQASISAMETGRKTPCANNLVKVADAVGCSLDLLFEEA
jgi:transcriptional regulator with XRE-family HTH domain